ncbi:putative protein-disulfide isomerase [Vreelandella songnenensis]|uniref:DSBA-like thioredoxin domain-containing protein n=1 Tax=Vreelandella songnenensis TaxID=1176243 RepID=A0A2T0V1Z9_9GAMM|nr:DsbA family protein [Halomonas songnenensis]PRY64209.1 putative protein-disulfide isomerase [Halomonas songnenensis]
MTKRLVYLMDPLCGWCYGATPSLEAVQNQAGITLELLPTGLFVSDGAREMDDQFAAYAWKNDQRIAALTSQPFSEAYRQDVLGNRHQRFDSEQATLALTAVYLTAPKREFEVLKAIQRARYVEGMDVIGKAPLVELLGKLGLAQAAELLSRDDESLQVAYQRRKERAHAFMRRWSLQGVPSLVVESKGDEGPLQSQALYSSPADFINAVIHA